MQLRIANRVYTIERRGLTYETFTKHYTLARLADNLDVARQELETAPEKDKRRQRERVKRLETRYDKAKLSIIG